MPVHLATLLRIRKISSTNVNKSYIRKIPKTNNLAENTTHQSNPDQYWSRPICDIYWKRLTKDYMCIINLGAKFKFTVSYRKDWNKSLKLSQVSNFEMTMTFKVFVLIFAVLFGLVGPSFAAWGFGSSDPGKVLLKDVQVLTLHSGKMKTGKIDYIFILIHNSWYDYF